MLIFCIYRFQLPSLPLTAVRKLQRSNGKPLKMFSETVPATDLLPLLASQSIHRYYCITSTKSEILT